MPARTSYAGEVELTLGPLAASRYGGLDEEPRRRNLNNALLTAAGVTPSARASADMLG